MLFRGLGAAVVGADSRRVTGYAKAGGLEPGSTYAVDDHQLGAHSCAECRVKFWQARVLMGERAALSILIVGRHIPGFNDGHGVFGGFNKAEQGQITG